MGKNIDIKNIRRQGPIPGICKQYGLWLIEGNELKPIVYFQKPSWINMDDWAKAMRELHLIPEGHNGEIQQR